MSRRLPTTAVTTLLLLACALGATGDEKAMKLADAVVKASGGDKWHTVKRLRFTFNVTNADGTPAMVARHDWDVRANSDTVTWDGNTVTVDLAKPGDDEQQKKAYQRWVNDSYWLLAPLKVKDGGVKLTHKGTQDVDGQPMEVLHLAFEGVGLTPGDQYNLYIDPKMHLVRRWDYMPNAEKKVTGTWEGYETFGPLTLSTSHQFGDRKITFTDVSVEAD